MNFILDIISIIVLDLKFNRSHYRDKNEFSLLKVSIKTFKEQ